MAKKTKQVSIRSLFKTSDDSLFLKDLNVRRFSSGIVPLDVACGGGIPMGRTIEIYGPESCGKTTITVQIIRGAQRKGGIGIYNDAEYALDDDRASSLRVDPGRLIMCYPDSTEDIFESMDALYAVRDTLPNDAPIVFAIDSIASTTPREILEGKSPIGSQARAMSSGLRRAASILSKTGTVLIGINQVRDKIGVAYGDPTTTPGGKAMKFYASIRIQVTPIGKLTGKDLKPFGFKFRSDDVAGHIIKMKTTKNKTARPFKEVRGYMLFDTGVHRELSMFETLRSVGLLKSSGKVWRMASLDLQFSKGEAIDAIKANMSKMRNALSDRFFGTTSDDKEENDGKDTE